MYEIVQSNIPGFSFKIINRSSYMTQLERIDKFNWDVAISLCKQDIEFAKKLVKSLNPSLKLFFYENSQEELISKSGPEKFANIFKVQSRIVVILSRKEWSESFYTEIERNAIIDRTAVRNEGYHFIIVIPMISGEIPSWYPSTHIYADPHRFTIDELARFIEFKVSDEGGSIKSITVEDRYQNLLNRIEEKKSIIQLQQDQSAIENGKDEVKIIKNCFNEKSKFLKKSMFESTSFFDFNTYDTKAHFGIGDFLLECEILMPNENYHRIVTTQDLCVSFKLFKYYKITASNKLLEQEQRYFYYTPELKGWSLPYVFTQEYEKERIVLFRNKDNTRFYDLVKPLHSMTLVDDWFQKLLSESTQSIEKYI